MTCVRLGYGNQCERCKLWKKLSASKSDRSCFHSICKNANVKVWTKAGNMSALLEEACLLKPCFVQLVEQLVINTPK